MKVEVRKVFRAGEWTVFPELNCLRNEQEERRVEPKVMKVLLVLADRQQHVVSKEELLAAVWPDTFVSDDVLTRCISVLRRVTHDDPQSPRFIQTIPRVGYRLLAEVEDLPDMDHAPSHVPAPAPVPPGQHAAVPIAELAIIAQEAPTLPSQPVPGSQPSRPSYLPFAIAIAVVVLLAVTALWFSHRRGSSQPAERSFRTLPFTSLPGEQLQPSFSPDGSTLAFVNVSEDGAARHLFLKQIGTEEVKQLTSGPGQDFSPVWSPDGTQIAYLSRSPEGLGLYAFTLASGQARKLLIPQAEPHWEQGALSWSPDGKTLLLPDHAGASPSSSVYEVDLATLQLHSVTTPPRGWEGDLTPVYSPDGRFYAFTRASETAVREIYYVFRKDGTLHLLTHHLGNIDSIAWSADSSAVLFSSNVGGKSALWRNRVGAATPERLPFGTEDALQPAVNARTGRIAYSQGSSVWKIVSIRTGIRTGTGIRSNAGSTPLTDDRETQTLLSSSAQDSAPALSPDGKRLAFQTQRSGMQEIWTANADGTNTRQLTDRLGTLSGSPAWSHHGDLILFDTRVYGHSHIFAISANGGTPRQLTFGDVNDITPHWSHDDAVLYFRSNRGGRWQLWRMPSDGGTPQPVTTGDGIVPQESADGKWLYYTRGGEAGIWRTPVAGGPETRMLQQPLAGFWGEWHLTPVGIFYLNLVPSVPEVRLFHPGTGQDTLVAKVHGAGRRYGGLTATDDGHRVLMSIEAEAGSHLTLVQSDLNNSDRYR